MQISKILTHNNILCSQTILSKKTALEEISKLLANSNQSLIYTDILQGLINREKLGSTGLGKGIAIPHTRLANNDITVAAFIKLQKSVDYDAIDGAPVNLLFALLVPEKSTEEHLNILAYLAKILSCNEILEQLQSSTTSDEIYQILTN